MDKQIDALIFDWAGTVVDFGCFAPTQIFVDAFKEAFDFEISLDEARKPMGLGKWEHIEALGKDDEIGSRWQTKFGRPMAASDIDHIYETFIPLQKERVVEHADLIPGFLPVLTECRQRGYKIGSTTGYPREVMQPLAMAAAGQGYEPDCLVCSGDVGAGGRPGPWMALECAIELGARAVWRCIKIDDTVPGIAEGCRAGMWTIGVTLSGSLCGITEQQFEQLADSQKEALRAPARKELKEAGAHYVIDTVADLIPILDEIDAQLVAGARP
ncbi:MAG: phosphonoacetaldehyde hydrolase [Burkholderiaceae bacterium]|nr:phosphonoacetaldehyde hydrolase [Burkholderiaceae bacterium]